MAVGNPATELELALFALRVASPTVVFLATSSLLFARPPLPRQSSEITQVVVAARTPRRGLILSLLSLVALTYLLDGITFVVHAVIAKDWPQMTGIEVNAIVGLVAFSGLAALGAYKDVKGVDVWFRGSLKSAVVVSLLLDIAQAVLSWSTLPIDRAPHPYPFPISIYNLLYFLFPILRLLILVPLTFALVSPVVTYAAVETAGDAEPQPTTSLLVPETTTLESGVAADAANGVKYGTFRSTTSAAPTTNSVAPTRPETPIPPTAKSLNKSVVNLDPSWREIGSRLKHIIPFLWPSKSVGLQLVAVLCIIILLLGRFIAWAVPTVFAALIAVFESGDGSPWPYLFGYVALRFFASSGGLAAVRDALWAPVMQYSDREMSELSFNHLLNLSLNWHMHRKTGEVLRILDRGAAINHIFELILFTIVPTFIDIVVALVFFAIRLDWTLSVLLFFVMAAYISASVVITRWRTKLRRQMNDRDATTRGIHTDCLLNYETVKYFGGEEHEAQRYDKAIKAYQTVELRVILSMNLLNLVQNFIITVGLLVGSMLVALRVVRGDLDASDFVFFITYFGQLYGPLNNLGYIYRSINQALVDTEKLLMLLDEPTEVNDKPNAPDLVVTSGEIVFDNVSFSYDDGRSMALKGVSFTVPNGGSVALVGESGAGKSTVLRLLYRFYDLGEGQGRILIDGQDIRDVTQKSLRKAIGVVPQDCVLFNATIAHNIGYGKFGATQEEIEEAAAAAQMHDRIIGFPDGYATKVGERGVRLSGGEKQRVAIARTLLKNPPVLLLDEATRQASALDTSTERDIQKALQNLVQGRSSLSIAHRLSTVATADLILVLKDGQIVEQGSHAQLLAQGGVFAAMWAEQVSVTEGEQLSVKMEAKPDDSKPLVSGYEVESEAPQVAEDVERLTIDAQPTQDIPQPEEAPVPATDASNAVPIAFPTSEDDAEPDAPVAFPSSDNAPDVPTKDAPVAFPTSDDTASQAPTTDSPAPAAASPGITFSGDSHPERNPSSDPESEPKRKRISSQNFQRLARRISVSARRTGSTGIPNLAGLLRRDSTQTSAKDGGEEPSLSGEPSTSPRAGSTDSPAPSVQTEPTPESTPSKLKKKDKKEKRKTLK
ncbi:hypothetical protein K488DRAFT_40032 [Vararia minispora EC-137]|uniref:Uncharacterized protein n=1 Tax=Vararia minispora EC-137 TaxID=1314806 RepID=A0ACB8QZ10_9AGAM|nr:hypothetical protein K488DRAFT_40032 [Vararia minispora EC-137]